MKKFVRFIAVFLCALFAAASAEAKDTLVIVTLADSKVMDPVAQSDTPSMTACNAVYDNLVYVDENGGVSPMLAESWEVRDGIEYVFHLRKGVLFHNGEEFKAADVKFSIDRALGPIGAHVNTLMQHVAGAEVIDDHTVVIRLKYPYSPFLPSLYNSAGAIVNRKAVEEAGDDYGMNPVGTGPFKFVSWQKGDRYTLERFEDYWGKKPGVKTLVVRSIPEPASRTIELESGAADIAFYLPQMDMKRIEENPELRLERVMTNGIGYLGFNTQKPPFDDVRVRQAVNAALDTEQMHKAVWRNVGQVPRSAVPPKIKYSCNDSYPEHVRDVEKARSLLKEAGIGEIKCQLWTNEWQERVDLATIIQEQLAEVGIIAEIKVLEWGAYLEGLKNKDHDMFILGWPTNVDPDLAFTNTMQTGMPMNFSFFSNAEFDELLRQGRLLSDGPEREALYKQAQDLVNEQCPWVYLYLEEAVTGTRKNVKGFLPLPSLVHEVREICFED